MKVHLFLLAILFITACDRPGREVNEDIAERSWNVRDVQGNRLILNGRKSLVLLGLEDSEAVESFIRYQLESNALQEPLRISLDGDMIPRRLNQAKILYGYATDATGTGINGWLIREKISSFIRKGVNDSLYIFEQYEKGETGRAKTSGDFAENVELLKSASFQVQTFRDNESRGTGSGFFISDRGIGVSNHHVFKEGNRWQVQRCLDGKIFEVQDVIAANEDKDFVIFRVIPDQDFNFLNISEKKPRQGDRILVYGNPLDLVCTLTEGIVSAIRGEEEDYIQIDAAISPGNSGSAVVNAVDNEVVGIATFKRLNCENCNFAMSIDVIRDYID